MVGSDIACTLGHAQNGCGILEYAGHYISTDQEGEQDLFGQLADSTADVGTRPLIPRFGDDDDQLFTPNHHRVFDSCVKGTGFAGRRHAADSDRPSAVSDVVRHGAVFERINETAFGRPYLAED